jgi:hypothetical protein
MRRVLRYASLGLERRDDLDVALARLLSSCVRSAVAGLWSADSVAGSVALIRDRKNRLNMWAALRL